MKKNFIEPKMVIVEIKSNDIIATSTGGSTSGGKWGARGMSDFDDSDNEF